MGVAPEEQRAVDALAGAVLADGLGRGEDVGLVERRREARATVTRGAEDDLLGGIRRVRGDAVVGGHEVGDVDEVGRLGGLAGAGGGHPSILHENPAEAV